MPIDITDQQRRAQYVISGTGPYDFDFEVLEQTDIAVYRDATLLTLAADYTVVINADGTGSVTLVSATGTTLTIIGARPYRRITDWATGGDFKAAVLNDELDSLQIQILQLDERADRTVFFSPTEAGYPVALPIAALRANKYLGFDASGFPNVYDPAQGAVSGAGNVNYLSSRPNAVSRTLDDYLYEKVPVTEFMTMAEKADYRARTKLLNLTTALNRAFSQVGFIIDLSYGDARFDTGLTEPVCAGIVGPGPEFCKLTANTGITKAFPLGAECRVHKGYQLVGNATAAARGFVLGDSEGGDYLFESVRSRGFTGAGAAGWFIKQALKTELMQCLGQGNFINWLIDGTGTAGYPTTVDLIGCGNADALDVGALIIHAETVRWIGGFSDSNAKEGIARVPDVDNTIANVITLWHRYEANYGATATEYQSTANGADGTCRFLELYPVFASSGAKSIRCAGSFCSGHLELPDVPNAAATILIESLAAVTRHMPAYLPLSVISDTTGQSSSVNWGQIEFPEVQNPSANPNVLDDFKELPFTPTLTFGSGSATYTSRAGSASKIGRRVFGDGRVVVNAVTAPSGTLEIGLGTLPAAGATSKGSATVTRDNIAMTGQVSASSATIRLFKAVDGANPGADVTNGAIIDFSFAYDV